MINILAKPVVAQIHDQLKIRVAQFEKKYKHVPFLSVVLVGNDPASVIYTRRKGEAAVSVGIQHETVILPETATPEEVKSVVMRLNQDPKVDGILIQRPLPAGFKEEELVYWVSPEKDVDAFHPENTGRLALGLPCFQPCTPRGVMSLLKYYGFDPSGKVACVIGRSSIVGKPMASLLLQANATVIHCHSKTSDLKSMTTQADILVVAAGKAGLITSEFVKPGSVVIDVGMHRNSEGKVTGDVVYNDVAKKVAAITPVPGGVGPMTIAILLENTVAAAENRAKMKK